MNAQTYVKDMGWRTYTLDGRPLSVELLAPSRWAAHCNGGPRSEGSDLAATIRAALGPRPAVGSDAWERWIEDQAARIKTEAERRS